MAERIATYSLIFDQPAVEKPDPAQWEPDTLPLVFAVSTRRLVPGMDHLGIRTDSGVERATTLDCLRSLPHLESRGARCCHARADKVWVADPNGIPRELYSGAGSIETFGEDRRPETEITGHDVGGTTRSPGLGACCHAGTDDQRLLIPLGPREEHASSARPPR